MEAKLYIQRAIKEGIEGEGVIVSSICKADSYQVGA